MLLRIALSADIGAATDNINWNADHFSSGVYVYRLQASKYVESKKLVLLK
ncbi:MAG: hypothetical protein ABSB78_01095 [Bacteroidota bacterium]